ncbi:hypothetical protein JL58_02545 [Listeria ivanovii subsp. londoniensis]|nr:hypothetical protein JL58_02545 [Listeria ivanovii subsp. londoniensis]
MRRKIVIIKVTVFGAFVLLTIIILGVTVLFILRKYRRMNIFLKYYLFKYPLHFRLFEIALKYRKKIK